MKMKKRGFLLTAVILLLVLATACSSQKTEEKTETAAEQAETARAETDAVTEAAETMAEETAAATEAAETLTEETAAPSGENESGEWNRDGYFTDENENILSVTYMDDIDEPGWYVGCMLGEDLIEDSWGGTLAQEGNTLHGVMLQIGRAHV